MEEMVLGECDCVLGMGFRVGREGGGYGCGEVEGVVCDDVGEVVGVLEEEILKEVLVMGFDVVEELSL